MNERLKFRFWDEQGKSYVNPASFQYHFNIDGHLFFAEKHNGLSLQNYPKVLIEQYTGVNDSNGKPIFEGDILRAFETIVEWTVHGDYVVVFEDARFLLKNSNYVDKYRMIPMVNSCEIIGNIHYNPELLND